MLGANFSQTPKRYIVFLTYVYEHSKVYQKSTGLFFDMDGKKYEVIQKDAYLYLPQWCFEDIKNETDKLYDYGLKRYDSVGNKQRYVFNLTTLIRKMAQLPKFAFTELVSDANQVEISRESPQYYRFENKVMERDNQTCQACGAHDHLQVHHIKSYKHYPKIRAEVSNGITLCQKCHMKAFKGSIHDLYGYSPNELDLQEFLDAKRTEYGLQPTKIEDIVKSKHT